MTTATPSAPTRAQLEQQIAEWLLSLLPPGRPRRLARMSKPGELCKDGTPRDKYQDIPAEQLTLAMLTQHARGSKTYSYTLDKDGKAREGALDVDEGGQPALLAGLRAAADLGVIAFAVENDSGGAHKGGHVIALFNDFYPAAHIKALMAAIAERAELGKVEIWPQNQGLRGLFGLHQLDQTRGNLLLQSGEIISLDDDLAAGFTAVQTLPLNGAPPAVEPPAPAERPAAAARPAAAQHLSHAQPRQRRPGERIDTAAIGHQVRERFNRETDWAALLGEYGGQQTRDGWRCNCGFKHSHDTQIAITSQGKIVSYSHNCSWAPHKDSRRALDKFGFYVDQAHAGNYRAALEALARQYGLWLEPRKARQEAPPLVEQPARQQTLEQTADAERKRAQRAQQATETRAAVELAASQDAQLSDSAQLVLIALLDVAGDRAWCRPSVARIEEMTSLCRRAVFYALAELERREYIRSSDAPGRTTVRTFLRVQAPAPVSGALHPDLNIQDLLPLTRGACERAPQPPAPEPLAEWECWQPTEWECSGYDLDLEAAPQVEPVQPALVELPAGWRIVRPARGPWCWAATAGAMTATHPRDTSDQVLISAAWLKAATLAEVRAVEPAQPEPVPESAQSRPNLVELEAPAGPGASYSPPPVEPSGAYTGRVKDLQGFAEQWAAATSAIKLRAAPADAPEASRIVEQEEPLVRAAPVEPAAAARYWSLKGKLRKATSTKQIAWLRREIADLEIWRPASELAASRASVGDARPSQARRAAGPPPSPAQQASLFGGAD